MIPTDGSHYISLSWQNAQRYCLSIGGHLVSINSEAENEQVKNLLKGVAMDAWIGARNVGEGMRFLWVDGGELIFSDWHTGEPNNDNGVEECASFRNSGTGRKWNDLSCDRHNAFICEII